MQTLAVTPTEPEKNLQGGGTNTIVTPTEPETVVEPVAKVEAHKEVGREYFSERHRLNGDFGIERHQGWIKYTTGRYERYAEARDQRQSYISAGHNFPGPFVTAYSNGERVMVQGALMISNQKWVQ